MLNREKTIIEEESNLLFYWGKFSISIKDEILEKLEKTVNQKELELSKSIKKRVYHLSVELLLNSYHHAILPEENLLPENLRSIHFGLGNKEQTVSIYCGNFIPNEQIESLTNRLNFLNSLPLEKLKELYQTTLANGSYSVRGTAGLGWIDIIKKTKSPIQFKMVDYDKHFSYFSVKISLEK